MLLGFTHDLRFTLRSLQRQPGFAAVAILTLALGVGANTAVFSVLNGVLLRPLAFHEPDRLVAIWPDRFLSNQEVEFLRNNGRTFESIATIAPWGMALTDTQDPTLVAGARTSSNVLDVLGVAPILGRGFLATEAEPGQSDVMLISDRLWARQFGRDSTVVGQQVTLDGSSITVIGVLPKDFGVFQSDRDVWTPLPFDRTAWYHDANVSLAIARLAPDATLDEADAEFQTLIPRMREAFEYSDDYGEDATVADLHETVVGALDRTLWLLWGAVGFVLLIAGANLSNLFLSRAVDRSREMALRTALGASRARQIRLLLTESVLVSGVGGALGIGIAVLATVWLKDLLPPDTPRLSSIVVDGTVLLVGATFSVAIGLLFGLAPALLGVRLGLTRREFWGRTALPKTRIRGVFVAVELALALVLVIGSGLMLKTLRAIHEIDPGFEPNKLLTFRAQVTGSRYETAESRHAFYQELFDRLRALPGVHTASAAQHIPLSGWAWGADIEIEEQPVAPGKALPRVGWRIVSPGYFQTMDIPLIEGRTFQTADRIGAREVAIVNATMAQELWPGTSAIGKRLRAERVTNGEWATVVGVVGDVHHSGLQRDPSRELYRPHLQHGMGAMMVVVRAAGDATVLANSVRQAVRALDPRVPIADLRTMRDLMAADSAEPRMIGTLLSVFSVIGLALAVVGVYGIVAYGVMRRTREIGIRLALGAKKRAVLQMIVREGFLYASAGIAMGTAAAIFLTRLLESAVWGVSTTDPTTFITVPLLLIGISLVASVIPARRAAHVNPAVTLRED